MDRDGKFFMTVVGIDHAVSDKQKLFDELEAAMHMPGHQLWPCVTFERELDNQYAPVAFRAKFNHRVIGYLESHLIDEALTLMDRHGRFSARLCGYGHKQVDTWVDDSDGRLARMAMSDICDDRITTTALFGIGHLPYLDRENDFEERSDDMLATLDAYIRDNLEADDDLLRCMREWLEVYRMLHRRTLCREDHGVVERIKLRLVMHDFHNENVQAVYREAFELHKDVPKGSCLEIMDYQLSHLREIAAREGGLLAGYRRVYLYKADVDKVQSEYDRIEEWLRTAIPYNIYARYEHDREKLARNFYYLRLTRREMYLVYEHMLVLEMLRGELTADADGKAAATELPVATTLPQSPAFPVGAAGRVEQLKVFFELLKCIKEHKGFASNITLRYLNELLDERLISKDVDERRRQLRDMVWLKIDETRGGLRYKRLPLPRLLELLGLWHARGVIVMGISPLANLIAVKIDAHDKCDTIRSQIQRASSAVTGYEAAVKGAAEFNDLPLIVQLFY